MNLIGTISMKPDPPGVDKARWVEIIREHPNLALFEPSEGINPFTKEPMIFQPRPDTARVLVGGREVGKMSWGKRGANIIQVFGDVEDVGPIAHEVAASLGAQFNPGDSGSRSEYERVLESAWRSISIYDGPEIFLRQFRAFRPEIGHLLAAQWCQSEVCNGGFHQFFTNSTGVLAPEALDGFRALGLNEWAGLLEEAMRFFGESYPRDREERQAKLSGVRGEKREEWDPFDDLDHRFYQCLRVGRGGFERVADEYARSINA